MKFLKKLVVLCALISGIYLNSYAQNTRISLDWREFSTLDDAELPYSVLYKPLSCSPCAEKIESHSVIPIYIHTLPLSYDREIAEVEIKILQTEIKEGLDYENIILNSSFDYEIVHYSIGRSYYGAVKITALRSSVRGLEILKEFEITVHTRTVNRPSFRTAKKKGTFTSVLSDGDVYKMTIPSSGIYKLTHTLLSQSGINPEGKSFSNLRVYGNGGHMLPEVIAADRIDDLKENALWIEDKNGNDKFDPGDFVLFYASGPDTVAYDKNNDRYSYSRNDYESLAYYFLKWEAGSGKRIQTVPDGSGLNPDLTLNKYDHVQFFEDPNEINFIKSGRKWWGYEMSSQNTRTFNMNIPGINTSSEIEIETVLAARTIGLGDISIASPTILIQLDGAPLHLQTFSKIKGAFDEDFCAAPKRLQLASAVSAENFTLSFTHSKPHIDSKAWIDYLLIIASRELKVYTHNQQFYNREAQINGVVKYQIGDLINSDVVFDITDPTEVSRQETYADGTKRAFNYSANENELRRFIIASPNVAPLPISIEKIDNQNLHGLTDIEYLIITRSDLRTEADRLAQFHRDYSGLAVEVVELDEVFNEFSSGSQDVTGIRDFVKLIYDRGQTGSKELTHLLLFGDASYDYKGRISPNQNIVPVYQSFNSHQPSSSHCSDDYYAILGDDEGYWGIDLKFEALDISVGRLPASNSYEAGIMVNKILHYHSEQSLGSWVTRTTVMADDQDANNHLIDGEIMTDFIYTQNEELNVQKIWLDAYEQISFGSGTKYPEVNAEVDRTVNQGTLVFHYVGHGGHSGMAHERVVTRDMINAWTNYDRLAFFITATCELGEFDNPTEKSPAELMILNPNGGAVGLISTTRVVYFGVNRLANLNLANDNLFHHENGKYKTLGEIYRDCRNDLGSSINGRSFSLLADPAMRLHRGEHQVVTTKINGEDFLTATDTLKALSKVTIEGEIHDKNGAILTDFNGTLYPTFFDKFENYQTRVNDPFIPNSSNNNFSILDTFILQNNVIFKGKISVTAGKFSFSFVVPKDISYRFGLGKMSYYAHSGMEQAGGYDNIMVGGTTDSLKDDQTPPELKLYMDDRSWVFGGTTNTTPLLLADIFDENGINTVGSGIGREMEAILDKGTEHEQSFVLNDFYQPELNSYQSGYIEYRFTGLKPGKHTVHLKVWDAYNNSSEAYTELIVNSSEDLKISNLLNYPNPFNQYTTFHFDHNRAGQNLIAVLTIYSVSGNIVKSMTIEIPNANTHCSDITWNGRDDFEDPLARGVYLYTLELKAEDGSTEKKTEKLYIIN